MNSYIVYLKSDQSVVARYVGGHQTSEQILLANGYNNSHNCIRFDAGKNNLNDYTIDVNGKAVIVMTDTIRDRKADEFIEGNRDLIEALHAALPGAPAMKVFFGNLRTAHRGKL